MDTNDKIIAYIKYINEISQENRFPLKREFTNHPTIVFDEDEKMWDSPLVGFSSACDSYYDFLKEDIGEFYCTPLEMFENKYGKSTAAKDDLSIVSIIFPQTKNTLSDSRKETKYPPARWVITRTTGDDYIRYFTNEIVKQFCNNNIRAVAPMLSEAFEIFTDTKYSRCSNWSERHTAFISGLGTFGLCDGLITPAGKAMRCTSIIFEGKIVPTKRPYKNHTEYCLYHSKGTCMVCAKRCPANAITKKGHDKVKCLQYQEEIVFPHMRKTLGFEPMGCGLCQTGVPCEHKIP